MNFNYFMPLFFWNPIPKIEMNYFDFLQNIQTNYIKPQDNTFSIFSFLSNFDKPTKAKDTNTQNSTIETTNNKGKIKTKSDTKTQKNGNTDNIFLNKVKSIAKDLNCDYRDLLAVMNAESGLKADARNRYSGATGLIQFLPSTAKSFGTTTEELSKMSKLEQLNYVERFLTQAKKQAGFGKGEKLSGGKLYALVFLPSRAKREILTTSNEKYYKANKGIDLNKDGKITTNELDRRVKSFRVNESMLA